MVGTAWGKHEFLPTGYLISRNRFCPITGYFLRNFLEISEFSPCPSHHVKYSFRTPSRTLTYYVLLLSTRLWTRNFRATLGLSRAYRNFRATFGLSRAYRNFSINFRESLTHTKLSWYCHWQTLQSDPNILRYIFARSARASQISMDISRRIIFSHVADI